MRSGMRAIAILDLFHCAFWTENSNYAYLSRDKHHLDEAWHVLKVACLGWDKVQLNARERKVRFDNGSEIRLVCTDDPENDVLKGLKFNSVLVDDRGRDAKH